MIARFFPLWTTVKTFFGRFWFNEAKSSGLIILGL